MQGSWRRYQLPLLSCRRLYLPLILGCSSKEEGCLNLSSQNHKPQILTEFSKTKQRTKFLQSWKKKLTTFHYANPVLVFSISFIFPQLVIFLIIALPSILFCFSFYMSIIRKTANWKLYNYLYHIFM